jgi:glyoxylase-like metal-dependent hydrolase (beta-lactamase superfamily II)
MNVLVRVTLCILSGNESKALKLICFLIFILSATVQAQQATVADHDRLKAKEILEKSKNALDPDHVLNSILTLEVNYTSSNNLIGQNASPEFPYNAIWYEGTMVFDLSQNTVVNDFKFEGGGSSFRQRVFGYADKAYFMDMDKIVLPGKAFSFPLRSTLSYKRRIVPFWLDYILGGNFSVKYGGIQKMDGIDHYSILVEELNNVVLYINKETLLPLKIVTYSNEPRSSPLSEIIFQSYRVLDNGILIPNEVTTFSNGIRQSTIIHQAIKFNKAANASLLLVPKGCELTDKLEEASVEEIASNIFFVKDLETGYNATFVNCTDHIVILDAPLSPGFSEKMINVIRQKFSDKPVKWVILSHYHNDHIGGLQRFIQQGAGVVSTKAMYDFSIRTLEESAEFNSKQAGQIAHIDVTKDTLIHDGLTPIRVLRVRNSHVNDMIMVYFPKQKVLWQADLLLREDKAGNLSAGSRLVEELHRTISSQAIQKQDLDIIIGVHGRPASFDDLLDLLQKRKGKA